MLTTCVRACVRGVHPMALPIVGCQGAYNITHLVADAVALIKVAAAEAEAAAAAAAAAGANARTASTSPGPKAAKKVHVVGHDWGGMMVAWFVAGQHPELVETLTILNAPHPSVFDRLIRTDPTEQKRSAYQLFFDTAAADQMDTASFYEKDRWFDPATEAAYKLAYKASGGPKFGLNWYRANIFGGRMNVKSFTADMPTNFPKRMRVSTRTLVLWGMRDTAFDSGKCLDGLASLVPNLTIKTKGYENTSHWIAQEKPELVSADIHSFIKNTGKMV